MADIVEKIPGFGERFKAARERMGMRQTDLGEKLGITRDRISNWERGAAYPELALFRKCCPVLGVTAGYLLDLDELLLTPKEMALIQRLRQAGPERFDAFVGILDHLDEHFPPTAEE